MSFWNLLDYYTIHKFVNDVKPLLRKHGNEELSALVSRVQEILDNCEHKNTLETIHGVKILTDSQLLEEWKSYYILTSGPPIYRCSGRSDIFMRRVLGFELSERGMESEMNRFIEEVIPDDENGAL